MRPSERWHGARQSGSLRALGATVEIVPSLTDSRQKIADELFDSLDNPDSQEQLLLRGPFGFGKSTVLDALVQRFEARHNGAAMVARVDAAKFSNAREEEATLVYRRIGESLLLAAGLAPGEIDTYEWGHTSPGSTLWDLFDDVFDRSPNRPALLVLDDLEKIARLAGSTGMLGTLRQLVQAHSDPKFKRLSLVAAYEGVGDIDNATASMFDTQTQQEQIPVLAPWTLGECRQLVQHEKSVLAANRVDTLFAMTGGHPMLFVRLLAAAPTNDTFDSWTANAAHDIVAQQLRRYFRAVSEDIPLRGTLRAILAKQSDGQDPEQVRVLVDQGLFVGEGRELRPIGSHVEQWLRTTLR